MAQAESRLGPLVHRAVHHAAVVWIVGAVQFVVAMAVVQIHWKGTYSLTGNVISDLGNTACGYWPSSSTHSVCSPWYLLFNVSVILLGLLVILGVILIRTAFPDRPSRSVGLGLIALAGIGSVGVGLFPENVHLAFHSVCALITFVGANLGLIVLGFVMFRDTRWNGYRAYTLFSGLIGLVALLLFLAKLDGALGTGGMERLVVAPLLLWLVVASIHLLRVPTYAPRIVPRSPGV